MFAAFGLQLLICVAEQLWRSQLDMGGLGMPVLWMGWAGCDACTKEKWIGGI